MKKTPFNTLVESVRQGDAILRGQAKPSRAFEIAAPKGPARVLLQVAAKHPDAVWDVVQPVTRQRRKATAASEQLVMTVG